MPEMKAMDFSPLPKLSTLDLAVLDYQLDLMVLEIFDTLNGFMIPSVLFSFTLAFKKATTSSERTKLDLLLRFIWWLQTWNPLDPVPFSHSCRLEGLVHSEVLPVGLSQEGQLQLLSVSGLMQIWLGGSLVLK